MEGSDPPRPVGVPPVEAKDEPQNRSAEDGSVADGAAPAAESAQAAAMPSGEPEVDGRSEGVAVPEDAPRFDEQAAQPVTPHESAQETPAPDWRIEDGATNVVGDEPSSPIDGERELHIDTPANLQPASPPSEPDASTAVTQQPDLLPDRPYVEPLEPWPDPLESAPPSEAHIGLDGNTAPLPRYQDAPQSGLSELPATYVEVPAAEEAGSADAARLEASPGHPFVPSPFAVPPPAAEPSPSIPSAPPRPALGPVKSRLVAAAEKQSLEAPASTSEKPPAPVDASKLLSPPETVTPILSAGLSAPARAAAPPAELQIPRAPPADPYARLEPSFGQPRPQDGFLDYRPWPDPEPSWPSPTAPEPLLPAQDPEPEPPSAPDSWATFGSATTGAIESRRAPPAFGPPSDQASLDRTSHMAAAMGASSSFMPMSATVLDPVAEPERSRRDWRDLVRRIAHAAFLVFAGWFIAVLMLIVAYRFVNPPFSMLMAQQFLTGTPIQKQWVPLGQISPNLRRAVIVSEDGRFCRHWGVDLIEAANALKRASDGYPRGASTITMQVAKNLFLLPAKSYVRKLIELPLTFAIELAWPKARILEVYLNIVEWGPGIFGAEAASKAHFGRSAANLSPRQAAQLAVALPNPIVRNAGRPGPRTSRKASVIQKRAAGARSASSCIDTVR